ncbi:MAG: hypothetical protein HC890_18300 [Chloroflexaceae bacterium]|nr:hypothetical protein [Chloroflexaceae bacterium]
MAKAEYLFNHTTPAGAGGDKQKFWRVSSRKIWEAKVSQFQLFDVIKLKELIAIKPSES